MHPRPGEPAPPGLRVLADDPSAADQDAYKVASTQAAKGVAVVTTRQGRWDHAVTVTDLLSVSYDPPTMLVSLYELSRIADVVVETGRFALSLLSDAQAPIADRLGWSGAPLVGLLDQVPFFRREPDAPAVLAGSLAWFELRVAEVHPVATHRLVVGRVVAMGSDASPGARPLVRWRSEYRR
ncbi:flavin reductase family protein [Microbacterium sp.]|uniref:flavin reductase family protein n=1 Tax=Microbacterium sp. TaxID=51671 RepID=UPI003A92B2AA